MLSITCFVIIPFSFVPSLALAFPVTLSKNPVFGFSGLITGLTPLDLNVVERNLLRIGISFFLISLLFAVLSIMSTICEGTLAKPAK